MLSSDPATESVPESASPIAPRPSLLAWALLAALLAGLVSWRAGEAFHGLYQPTISTPENWDQMNMYEKDSYRSTELKRTRPPAETKNAALTFGALGLALGCGLGLVGGRIGSRRRGGATAAALGAALGLAAGAGSAAVAVPLFFRFLDPEFGGLAVPTLTQIAILATIGAAAGAGLGWGLAGRRMAGTTLVGGLVGGLLGGVLYEAILAIQFPLMRLLEPIPTERPARLVMHLTATLAIAAVASLAALGTRRRA